jgi:hypothetical protein
MYPNGRSTVHALLHSSAHVSNPRISKSSESHYICALHNVGFGLCVVQLSLNLSLVMTAIYRRLAGILCLWFGPMLLLLIVTLLRFRSCSMIEKAISAMSTYAYISACCKRTWSSSGTCLFSVYHRGHGKRIDRNTVG